MQIEIKDPTVFNTVTNRNEGESEHEIRARAISEGKKYYVFDNIVHVIVGGEGAVTDIYYFNGLFLRKI